MLSCYAFCSDMTHGLEGWTGPIRTGEDARRLAERDAQQHNLDHPDHEVSTSCAE
ncbi:MAG: hypothetical protein ACRD3D_10395 [Terriglobia bacterium]